MDGGRRPVKFATHPGARLEFFVMERARYDSPAPAPPVHLPEGTPSPGAADAWLAPARCSSLGAVPWRWGDVLIGLAPVVGVKAALLLPDPWWLSARAPWLRWLLMVLGVAWLLAYPLWVARRRHAPRPRLPGLRAVAIEFGLAVPLLLAVWMALAFLVTAWALLRCAPEPTPGPLEPVLRSTNWVGTVAMILLAVVAAPLAEEVFCRGMLYSALRQRLPLAVALLAQAVLFGAAHTHSVAFAVQAGLLGLALGAVYQWRGTLLAPVLLHGLYNAAAVALAAWLAATSPDPPVLGVGGDPAEQGCRVTLIVAGSGAEEAGLRVGDVITAVDGRPVADIWGMMAALRRRQAGDRVRVDFLRGGEPRHVEAVLRARPR